MPVYCYTDADGNEVDVSMTYREMRSRHDNANADGSITMDNGQRLFRDMGREIASVKDTPGNWPMESDAAGCHPEQRMDYMKHMASRGVPTEYNAEGQAIFTSRSHRRAALKVLGLVDKDGGDGDV
jgi:hypothetical protein